jgi:GNAT superfamily N-acetyltransferase
MAWRLSRSAFEAGKEKKNKLAMKRLIVSGDVPGILAYDGRIPIGWCSVARREEFSFLSRSRVLSPIDDNPVWSISCFFVKKEYRAQGVSVALLKAAIEHVKKNKGMIVEGYPIIPYGDKMPDVFAWTGILSAFKKAGFREAGRRSNSRPMMRYYI